MTDGRQAAAKDANPTVDAMTHRFLQVHHMDKAKVVARIAAANGRTLVFCRTKRNCDKVQRDLVELGVRASAIHGDLPQYKRERALAQFSDGSRPVLVATDVAARGIHVDDVQAVVHYDPPEDQTAYLHRSGRTARAGATGLVVCLVEWNQELDVRRVQRRRPQRHPPWPCFHDARLDDLAWTRRRGGSPHRPAGPARDRPHRGRSGADGAVAPPACGEEQCAQRASQRSYRSGDQPRWTVRIRCTWRHDREDHVAGHVLGHVSQCAALGEGSGDACLSHQPLVLDPGEERRRLGVDRRTRRSWWSGAERSSTSGSGAQSPSIGRRRPRRRLRPAPSAGWGGTGSDGDGQDPGQTHARS
jgi:hypothetical protein